MPKCMLLVYMFHSWLNAITIHGKNIWQNASTCLMLWSPKGNRIRYPPKFNIDTQIAIVGRTYIFQTIIFGLYSLNFGGVVFLILLRSPKGDRIR